MPSRALGTCSSSPASSQKAFFFHHQPSLGSFFGRFPLEGLTTPTEVLEWRHGGPSRPGGACGTGFTGSGFAKPLERELEFLAWPRAKCFTHTDQACPFRTDLVRTAFLAEHVVSPENSSDSPRSSGASGSTDGSLEGTLSVSQILGSLERIRRALKKQSAGSPEDLRAAKLGIWFQRDARKPTVPDFERYSQAGPGEC